jgi:hypothetical protein
VFFPGRDLQEEQLWPSSESSETGSPWPGGTGQATRKGQKSIVCPRLEGHGRWCFILAHHGQSQTTVLSRFKDAAGRQRGLLPPGLLEWVPPVGAARSWEALREAARCSRASGNGHGRCPQPAGLPHVQTGRRGSPGRLGLHFQVQAGRGGRRVWEDPEESVSSLDAGRPRAPKPGGPPPRVVGPDERQGQWHRPGATPSHSTPPGPGPPQVPPRPAFPGAVTH